MKYRQKYILVHCNTVGNCSNEILFPYWVYIVARNELVFKENDKLCGDDDCKGVGTGNEEKMKGTYKLRLGYLTINNLECLLQRGKFEK